MESSKERYIPALGYSFLTPLYDPIVALSCREKTFKIHLLEQSDFQHGHKILDLGFGTGTFAVQIKQSIPEAEVISIDGDPAILDTDQLTRQMHSDEKKRRSFLALLFLAGDLHRSAPTYKNTKQKFKAYLQFFGLTSSLFGYTLYINKFWRHGYAKQY